MQTTQIFVSTADGLETWHFHNEKLLPKKDKSMVIAISGNCESSLKWSSNQYMEEIDSGTWNRLPTYGNDYSIRVVIVLLG